VDSIAEYFLLKTAVNQRQWCFWHVHEPKARLLYCSIGWLPCTHNKQTPYLLTSQTTL